MKKLITILLSVLLIASLFVSCDNATKAVQDELAEVALSTQASSRSLTVSNPLEALSDVSWTYTARKVSENQFNYGESPKDENGDYMAQEITLFATSEKPKTTLTLSQGKWVFELFGRNDSGTLLYYGITGEVLILRSNGLNQITVEVSPYTSAKGTLELSNIVVNLNTPVTIDGAEKRTVAPNYLKVNNSEYSDFDGSKTFTDLTAGQYTVTVKFVSSDDGLTYAEETVVATVYSGRTTTVGGNLSEETGSGTIQGEYVDGNTSVVVGKVEEGKDLVLVSSVVPVDKTNNSEANTTVTFPAGAIDGSSAQLSVEVKGVDSNFEVSIPSGETVSTTPIASIDLSVKVGDTTVSSFNGKSVKVETYILKNLDSTKVKVSYNGEKLPDSNYDPVTGKLTFSTTHFSTFDVLSDAVCYNQNSNRGYSSLIIAAEQSESGDVIVLLNDVTIDPSNSVVNSKGANCSIDHIKGITLDGNGFCITAAHDKYVFNKIENSIIKDVNFIIDGKPVAYYGSYNSKTVFERIVVEGTAVFGHNQGFFANYAYCGDIEMISCENRASSQGGAGANGYNAVFLGYITQASNSYINLTFTDCKNSGSLISGRSSFFIGNPNAYKIRIVTNGCSNSGIIKSMDTNSYNMNWYVSTGSNNYYSFIVNDIEKGALAETNLTKLPNINNDTTVENTGIVIKAVNDGLSVSSTSDGIITITPTTNESVAKYEIKVGLYANLKIGGSSIQYATQIISADETDRITLKVLPFVDEAFKTSHENGVSGSLAGNETFAVDGKTYYVIPEKDIADTRGQIQKSTILIVGAYNSEGSLLSSATGDIL